MSGFFNSCDCYDRQAAAELSNQAKDLPAQTAIVDLVFAVVGVLAAVQLCFGNKATKTHFVLSLALPVLWLVAAWIAGGYYSWFIGTGSGEFR